MAALTVGELVGRFDVDPSGAERGIAQAELAMLGLQRDVDGTLRDLHGDVVTESEAIGRAIGENIRAGMEENLSTLHPEIDVDANTRPADEALAEVFDRMRALSEARIGVDLSTEDAYRQLNDLMGRLGYLAHQHPEIDVQARAQDAIFGLSLIRDRVEELDRMHPVIDVDVHAEPVIEHLEEIRHAADRIDDGHPAERAARDFSRFTNAAKSTGTALGGVALSVGRVAAMLGTAVPAAAGLVGALAAVAPAGGLAAAGVLMVVSATAALKIGLTGVSDAVSAALDPSNPEKYAESLKGLAPEARAFVQEVHKLQPDLDKLRKDVQNRLFDGLSLQLAGLAKSTLPVVRRALGQTADALNAMGHSVADTAAGLTASGALGKALGGASASLYSLSRLPGLVVQGLVQIGAAAAPALQRLTAAGGGIVDTLAAKLNSAFASGALERAIEQAISLLGDLMTVVGNVGRIVGSVFSAAQTNGGGFIGTLKAITGAMADAFASAPVQDALKALFGTMSLVAKTAAPLLAQALGVIGPVISALAPGIQTLITALGQALQPVITALGPVLLAAAQAISQLLVAVSPLLPVLGQLIAALGPILTPIITALGTIFTQLAPVIATVANVLSAVLGPILAALPQLIQPFMDILTTLTGALLPVVADLLTALQPALVQVADIFGQLAKALAPVLQQLAQLIANGIKALMPLLDPLIKLVGQLATIFAGELGKAIQQIVIPALQMVSQLLSGDVRGAFSSFKEAASGVAQQMLRMFVDLPGQILSALGDLGMTLWNAGGKLISGLISGIKSKIGDLGGVLGDLGSFITEHKGPPAKDAVLLTPAGRLLMDGLMAGIDSRVPALRSQLGGLTGRLPGMLGGMAGSPAFAGGYAGAGGGFHIENYYEAADGNARSTAAELEWLRKGRG